jgi:hypothetical protein
MANKPVTYVNWLNCARYCNWLTNGREENNITETGAYTLNGLTDANNVPKRNPTDLGFFLPKENEWYKTAYYKGGGINAGYWNVATQSDLLPTFVTANNIGNGMIGNQPARVTDYTCYQ